MYHVYGNIVIVSITIANPHRVEFILANKIYIFALSILSEQRDGAST